MKTLIVLCIVVVAAVALPHRNPDLDEHWQLYKKVNQKQYSAGDEQRRRMIWEAAVKTVAAHNRKYDMGLSTYRKGVNKFADLTDEEFVARFTGARPPTRTFGGKFYKPSGNPDVAEVDWRNEGAVTEVKNQGECGGCWSFSSTGSVEGQNFLKTGELISLSEQQLIDCSTDYGNTGCRGGWMDFAFEYIKHNGGINSEAEYPFQMKRSLAVNMTCRFNPDGTRVNVTGFVAIAPGKEDDLQDAIANVGPISVAISVSKNLRLYSSGILDDLNCTSSYFELDHGVLAVGYGTGTAAENYSPYWLIKNSYSTSWGEEGYFRLLRDGSNMCGIATAASYPTV